APRARHSRRERHRQRVSRHPAHAEPRDREHVRGNVRHAHAHHRARHHRAGRDPMSGEADFVVDRKDLRRTAFVAARHPADAPAGLVHASPHRTALPPAYNAYTRVAADPAYDRAREGEIALFRPLFTTSFLLDDFLGESRLFGARALLLSSASSKTALGLAYLC